MTCDEYLELLALRLDGPLTEKEERELEAHLAACPDCRAAGAQLAALQGAFDDLENIPAPEDFVQSVMERIRTEEPRPKVVPLFKRPQFKAFAGLAACLVLAVGLYGAAQPQKQTDEDEILLRSFNRDASDVSAQEVLPAPEDPNLPMITAYADPGEPVGGTENASVYGMQKSAPGTDTYDGAAAIQAAPMVSTAVLTLDHMPEGAWELIPPETPVSPEGLYVTEELFDKVEQLAQEEGITTSITISEDTAEEFLIVVLEELE